MYIRSILSKVVFPAPLGPTNPNIPGFTDILTSIRASTSPKDFEILEVEITCSFDTTLEEIHDYIDTN